MRLIGTFKQEQDLRRFHAFLKKEGIESTYDVSAHPPHFLLWIEEEDAFEKAEQWYREFQENPADKRFKEAGSSSTFPKTFPQTFQRVQWKIRLPFPRIPQTLTLTHYLVLLCTCLFVVNAFQVDKIKKQEGEVASRLLLAPVQKLLFFDFDAAYFSQVKQFLQTHDIKMEAQFEQLSPQEAQAFLQIQESRPWKGISYFLTTGKWSEWEKIPSGALFHRIREGEFWRLITPCFLHAGFLHIFFNMAWVLLLGKQMEGRLGKGKMVLFILITGMIANTAQYLMGGPDFLGFSGVVVGMVGFIWMRQKLAPWEGYPLQKSTTLFILVFVGAMLLLEIFAMALEYLHIIQISGGIANTAHIVGGVVGALLGRSHFFARSVR